MPYEEAPLAPSVETGVGWVTKAFKPHQGSVKNYDPGWPGREMNRLYIKLHGGLEHVHQVAWYVTDLHQRHFHVEKSYIKFSDMCSVCREIV